jgi:membrane protease YdiL (CAAX protease family)
VARAGLFLVTPARAAYRRRVISEPRWTTASVLQLAAMVMMSFGLAIGCSNLVALAGPMLGGRLSPEHLILIGVVVSLFCVQGLAVLWIHLFLRMNGQTWGEAFGLARRNYGQCATLTALALVLALLTMGLTSLLSMHALEFAAERTGWAWLKPEPQAIAELLKKKWPWWLLLPQGIAAIVIAPVGEELLFRGVLYGFIKQRGRPRLALWTSALLFAAVHGNAVGFLFFVILSLLLVALYEQTQNILAPILLHASFNAVSFTLIVTQPHWSEKLFQG